MNSILIKPLNSKKVRGNRFKDIMVYIWKERFLYLMLMPGIVLVITFCYVPMYGILAAFENYRPIRGILGSEWVGLKHFSLFFSTPYIWRILSNTIIIFVYSMIFCWPISIIFALLLNEVRKKHFKRLVQTISYMPHFLSTVVVVAIVVNFLSPSSGIINIILNKIFGMQPIFFLIKPEWFRTIYISMATWQGTGWGAIIYLAAIAAVDIELYEYAVIDGAGRLRQMWHITLPGILPTIVIMLLLSLSQILNVSCESIILLYNPMTYETADVISSYIFRMGIQGASFSLSTAVGLFQSLVGLIILVVMNKAAKKITETGLW